MRLFFYRFAGRVFVACCCVGFALASAAPSSAQTYTPKQIRLEGATGMDSARLLGIAALPAGVPLTKEQIEAALQRLGDTGLFSNLSYTVGPEALVFKLTPSASSQALPVRYANFTWWQPGQLELLVEARVPLFHGKLPLTGTLTDQVEAALTTLLKEKGVSATVTARHSEIGGESIALSISQPEIDLGQVRLEGTSGVVAQQLQVVEQTLSGQDFDLAATSAAIRDNVGDMYRNAGYLDVATDAPVFSEPRKDLQHYDVDATAVVHEGQIYRIGKIEIASVAPLSSGDLERAAEINSGDPASVMGLRIAKGLIGRAYRKRGYLDAAASATSTKDSSAHTVGYSFTIAAGEIYHLAGVDASALPARLQAEFASFYRAKTGAVADESVLPFRALTELHANNSVKVDVRKNRSTHMLTIVLTPKKRQP